MKLPFLINDPSGDHTVTLKGHASYVLSVAFSPSSHLLASGSADNTIKLWNTESLDALPTTLNGHSNTIDSIAFSPDGTMLASGSWNATVKLWDVRSRAEIAILRGHSGSVYSVAFSPGGKALISGSRDKTIQLWDVKSKTNISTLEGHSSGVNTVAFSPDGRSIASGSDDHTIRLWQVGSKTSNKILNGHSGGVTSVAFSPAGEYIASGSTDKTIRIWAVSTGSHVTVLEGHLDVVRSVAFSPSGNHLASGSYDRTIRLWDMVSRTHISTLKGHSKDINSVAFSPDGMRLASGSDDHIARIWNVSPEEAWNTQDSTFTSESIQLTMSTTGSQRNTAPWALQNDITGTVSLQSGRPIGYGGYNDLFLGVHQQHGKVALKRPRRLLDEALIRRFLREVDLWCSVSHVYILPCLGMCRIGMEIYVASPFIENGDLLSCIQREMPLNRRKVLFEVAEALTHLHHKGIVHGDVKAQNILLADDGSALLCDFGLAKAFDTMATSTEAKGAGSVRWMAPELFFGESRSMASDVYSLGITIAEVLSGHAPYPNLTESLAVMLHAAYHDGRPAKEPLFSPEGNSYVTLWETADKCWVKDPKARPHMAQVLAMLFSLTREKN